MEEPASAQAPADEPPPWRRNHLLPWQSPGEEEWNDWRWQLRHRRTALEELQHLLHLTTEEESGILAPNRMRLGITPCSATFISSWELLSPARQVVPTTHELERSSSDMPDPLCEDAQAPVPGLVHRYADHAQLADAGIPLGSETVLLAGINDDHAATVSADQVEGRPRLPVVEREPSGLGESR